MRFCLAVLAAVLAVSGVAPAKAAMLISEDRGGQIGHYLQTYAMLRSTGEHVIIDGNCLSACTLVLGIIPRDRLCVTPRARLGFHAAWMPDAEGHPVTSPMGTQALWNLYPMSVRHWINRHGGLSRKMIYLQGRDLASVVPMCGAPHKHMQARSHRTISPQALRYQRASAASNSR